MKAEFLWNVNTSFDILNLGAFDSKAASPVAQESNDELEHRRRLKDDVGMWRIEGMTSRPPCFDGLIHNNINEVLEMHQSAWSVHFLLTERLNQDCIENFFSKVCAKGGHRFNPSAREFHFAYRSLCSNTIRASIQISEFDSDVKLSSLSLLSQEGYVGWHQEVSCSSQMTSHMTTTPSWSTGKSMG